MRVVFIAALLLLPAAAAQMPDPPHISTEDMVLYAHVGPARWLNTVQDDPDHSGETATIKFTEAAASNALTWTLMPGLTQPVTLDAAGKVEFRLGFGCGLVAHAGILEVTLRLGSDVIAAHEFDPSICPVTHLPGAISYAEYKASVAPAMTMLEPGQDLTWEVKFTGVGAAFMQVGQGGSYSYVTLPVLGPVPVAPTTASEVLNGTVHGLPFSGAGDVLIEVGNRSSQTHVYNWTNPFRNVTVDGSFNGTGNATVRLVDAGNVTVFEQTFAANTTIEGALLDVSPGNWTLQIDLDDATGRIVLRLSESVSAAQHGNATETPQGEPDDASPAADSPGFEAVALLALLGAVAVVARRRK